MYIQVREYTRALCSGNDYIRGVFWYNTVRLTIRRPKGRPGGYGYGSTSSTPKTILVAKSREGNTQLHTAGLYGIEWKSEDDQGASGLSCQSRRRRIDSNMSFLFIIKIPSIIRCSYGS